MLCRHRVPAAPETCAGVVMHPQAWPLIASLPHGRTRRRCLPGPSPSDASSAGHGSRYSRRRSRGRGRRRPRGSRTRWLLRFRPRTPATAGTGWWAPPPPSHPFTPPSPHAPPAPNHARLHCRGAPSDVVVRTPDAAPVALSATLRPPLGGGRARTSAPGSPKPLQGFQSPGGYASTASSPTVGIA